MRKTAMSEAMSARQVDRMNILLACLTAMLGKEPDDKITLLEDAIPYLKAYGNEPDEDGPAAMAERKEKELRCPLVTVSDDSGKQTSVRLPPYLTRLSALFVERLDTEFGYPTDALCKVEVDCDQGNHIRCTIRTGPGY